MEYKNDIIKSIIKKTKDIDDTYKYNIASEENKIIIAAKNGHYIGVQQDNLKLISNVNYVKSIDDLQDCIDIIFKNINTDTLHSNIINLRKFTYTKLYEDNWNYSIILIKRKYQGHIIALVDRQNYNNEEMSQLYDWLDTEESCAPIKYFDDSDLLEGTKLMLITLDDIVVNSNETEKKLRELIESIKMGTF